MSSSSFNLTPVPGTVHFDEAYINFQFRFIHFPTITAIIPWFYMIPTFLKLCSIIKFYWKTNWKMAEACKNQYVFLVISLSQSMLFGLFLSDFFMTRFPSTGIMTSFCASIPPNHWLKMILFVAVYFNYLAMYFPFLMPVVRLIILNFPFTHSKINKNLVRFIIPLLFLTPICFTFYLIPALGVCRQRSPPYPFGSLWIHFIDSAYGLTNRYFHFCNIIFWMLSTIFVNGILFYQVKKARSKLRGTQTSDLFKRANTSLTITTVAMIIFYVINAIFLIIFILYYGTTSYLAYLEIIRPFGNDLQFCVVTWVFYLTHPSFRITSSPSNTSGRTWLQRRI